MYDGFKVKRLKSRLEFATQLDRRKLIFEWVKTGAVSCSEFSSLLHFVVDVERREKSNEDSQST